MLTVLTVLVSVFGLWWAVAYVYAYRQVRDRLFFLQIGQGLSFALMFSYITVVRINEQPLNGLFVGVLILMALAAGFVWRSRGGAEVLIQRYPRGMLDVLSFRKPTADLRRRVRGK